MKCYTTTAIRMRFYETAKAHELLKKQSLFMGLAERIPRARASAIGE